ncbi:hypothetical protein vseg_019230 [Gypsophila vaccaria]
MSSTARRDEVEEEEEHDSDGAPEEFTSHQGLLQSQELTKAQQQSIASARLQLKERRKKWAQRLTPKPKPSPLPQPQPQPQPLDEMEDDDHTTKPSQLVTGMLPTDIVSLLAAREKQVFESDSDQDISEKKPLRKKIKTKKKNTNVSGVETLILKDLPPAHCIQNSLDFLKKRKMQVTRSSAILKNSNQALRFLSSSGSLN